MSKSRNQHHRNDWDDEWSSYEDKKEQRRITQIEMERQRKLAEIEKVFVNEPRTTRPLVKAK
jgi:hypothetical protein